MDIRNEIVEFINTDESNGALLITGHWGCGKTHLVKALVTLRSTLPREDNAKKKKATSSGFLFLVESRGVEPLSENLSIHLSPGAFCLLRFRITMPTNRLCYAYRFSS